MRETKFWILHMAAGLVILALLGTHMAIMHLGELLRLVGVGPGSPIEFANVAARGRLPIFMVTYVILLAAALFHGLFGLRTILLELTLSPRAERAVTVTCWGVGVVLFLVGAWAAVAAFLLPGGAS